MGCCKVSQHQIVSRKKRLKDVGFLLNLLRLIEWSLPFSPLFNLESSGNKKLNLSKISNSVFDSFLPTYPSPKYIPITYGCIGSSFFLKLIGFTYFMLWFFRLSWRYIPLCIICFNVFTVGGKFCFLSFLDWVSHKCSSPQSVCVPSEKQTLYIGLIP